MMNVLRNQVWGLALITSLAISVPVMAAEKTEMKTTTSKTTTMSTSSLKSAKTTLGNEQMAALPAYSVEAQQQYIKGQSLLVEKRYPEAIEAFQSAINIEPSYTVAHQGLAQAFYQRGEYDQALAEIQKASSIDPLYTQLVLDKARILDAQKKEGGALEGYLTFLSLNPYDSSRLDIQRRAMELYDKWAPKMTETQKAYYNGLRALAMENPQEATTDLKSFISNSTQTNDQVINAQRLLGLAYQELNRPTEAVAIWEVITKQQPENAVSYFHLSNVYEQTGKPEQAKQAWTSYLKNAPNAQAYLQERPYFQQVLVVPTPTTR
jgi:tetratricopeptide (TPR) repeat protein